MCYYSPETPLSFRGEAPFSCRLLLRGALGAFLFTFPLRAQDRTQPPPDLPPNTEAPAPSPTGFGITSLSLYSGAEWQQYPESVLTGPNLFLLVGGAAADVNLHLTGPQTQFSASYRASYSGNDKFAALDGFTHTVTFNLRSELSSRTSFTITGSGQSGLANDSLFGSTYSLSLVQVSSTVNQLSNGVSPGGSATMGNTPVDLALAGLRREGGTVNATLTHSFTPRLAFFVETQAERELRSGSGQQLASSSPNFTVGMADLGLKYSMSPHTRITGTLSYARTYAHLDRDGWGTGSVAIEHDMGGHAFGSIQAGYQQVWPSTTGDIGRGAYTVSGAVGTNKGMHRLVATVSRGVSDLHGLGADNSLVFDGAWSWSPRGTAWTMGSSVAYERILFTGSGTLQAYMAQVQAGYWISPHFEISFEGVYLTDFGGQPTGLTFRGARFTLLWSPEIGLHGARHATATYPIPN